MDGKELSAKARELGLSQREEMFCYELVKNGGQKREAALAAGYKEKSAGVSASRALNRKNVQEFLAFLNSQTATESVASAQEVLEGYTRIIRADPNELISNVIGCCRYCWGKDHMYQWTPEEFRVADSEYQRKKLKAEKDGKSDDEIFAQIGREPDPTGGLDFDIKREPHTDCPECHGLGEQHIQTLDSRHLTPEAKELYAGAKQTAGGFEILMHSKEKARDALAKHHNLFEKHEKAGSGEIHVHLSEKDACL